MSMTEEQMGRRLKRDLRKLGIVTSRNRKPNPSMMNPGMMGGYPMSVDPESVRELREGNVTTIECSHLHIRPSTEEEIERYCFDEMGWGGYFTNRQQRNLEMMERGIQSVRKTKDALFRSAREYVTICFDGHDVDLYFINGEYGCSHKRVCINSDCEFRR